MNRKQWKSKRELANEREDRLNQYLFDQAWKEEQEKAGFPLDSPEKSANSSQNSLKRALDSLTSSAPDVKHQKSSSEEEEDVGYDVVAKLQNAMEKEDLDIVEIGKLIDNGLSDDSLTTEMMEEIQDNCPRKRIDMINLHKTLHGEESLEVCKQAIMGLAFASGCNSEDPKNAQKGKKEVSNTVPIVGLCMGRMLECQHITEENTFSKETNLNVFYANYHFSGESRDNQLRRFVREVLEYITKSPFNLWRSSYCESREGRASSKFEPFPTQLVRTIELFCLDAQGLHLPPELLETPAISFDGNHPKARKLGNSLREQKKELHRRQHLRKDKVKEVRELIVAALQHFRSTKHFDLERYELISCKCPGGNSHIRWKDLEQGKYMIINGIPVDVTMKTENVFADVKQEEI